MSLWFEVARWQMRLEMSHNIKLSDTAFFLDPPFGELNSRLVIQVAFLLVVLVAGGECHENCTYDGKDRHCWGEGPTMCQTRA